VGLGQGAVRGETDRDEAVVGPVRLDASGPDRAHRALAARTARRAIIAVQHPQDEPAGITVRDIDIDIDIDVGAFAEPVIEILPRPSPAPSRPTPVWPTPIAPRRRREAEAGVRWLPRGDICQLACSPVRLTSRHRPPSARGCRIVMTASPSATTLG